MSRVDREWRRVTHHEAELDFWRGLILVIRDNPDVPVEHTAQLVKRTVRTVGYRSPWDPRFFRERLVQMALLALFAAMVLASIAELFYG